MRVLVVDGANVVGSRPDGWWRDREGAARRLHARLLAAGLDDEVVLVLEGKARAGVPEGYDAGLRTVHAPRDGDAAIVDLVRASVAGGGEVTVVTADRALRADVDRAGGRVVGPSWLLDRLG